MNVNQQNIRVNLDDAEDIVCDECGNSHFEPAFLMKRVSALVSPTGQEALIPVQTFQCNKCGHVNEIFMKPRE
tara:strand:+ start:5108 stop:5326 length:219 start_codon:yes stop_codon:yes gene_type:complete